MPSGVECENCGYTESAHHKKKDLPFADKSKAGFRTTLKRCRGYKPVNEEAAAVGMRMAERVGRFRLSEHFGKVTS